MLKAALVFLFLVVAPAVIFRDVGAFLFILAIGLPATLWFLPREKPSRLDPSIWSSDAAETERRYATALRVWRKG